MPRRRLVARGVLPGAAQAVRRLGAHGHRHERHERTERRGVHREPSSPAGGDGPPRSGEGNPGRAHRLPLRTRVPVDGRGAEGGDRGGDTDGSARRPLRGARRPRAGRRRGRRRGGVDATSRGREVGLRARRRPPHRRPGRCALRCRRGPVRCRGRDRRAPAGWRSIGWSTAVAATTSRRRSPGVWQPTSARARRCERGASAPECSCASTALAHPTRCGAASSTRSGAACRRSSCAPAEATSTQH